MAPLNEASASARDLSNDERQTTDSEMLYEREASDRPTSWQRETSLKGLQWFSLCDRGLELSAAHEDFVKKAAAASDALFVC